MMPDSAPYTVVSVVWTFRRHESNARGNVVDGESHRTLDDALSGRGKRSDADCERFYFRIGDFRRSDANVSVPLSCRWVHSAVLAGTTAEPTENARVRDGHEHRTSGPTTVRRNGLWKLALDDPVVSGGGDPVLTTSAPGPAVHWAAHAHSSSTAAGGRTAASADGDAGPATA